MKNKVINLFGNQEIPLNDGVKYSKLLEKFIAPFSNELKGIPLEEILEFSVNAWNFGNMKVILPENENIDIPSFIDNVNVEINVSLLNTMIDYKIAKFKEHTNFIVDYDFTVKKGKKELTVTSISEEEYLSTALNDMEYLENEADFEENYINRCAVIVKPLQPFIEWYNTLNPDSPPIDETELDEANVYLVNNKINDLEIWLKKKFDTFFRLELEDWHTNKKEWPQKRNYKMFKQWFQVDVASDIYDLEKKPIIKFDDDYDFDF